MSMDWRQPEGGGPSASSRWPPWAKVIIILTILAVLAWVVLLATQYCETRRPLTELPGVPDEVAGLLGEPPQYLRSFYGVERPLGVAISDDGRVFVTESGGERMIHMFDRSGREISAFAPPDNDAPLRVPVYVAVSPKGEVYVSDRDRATIHIFSADGSYLSGVDSPLDDGAGWHPLGLAFDAEGNLYVTEVTPEKHRVLVLDSDGDLKLEFGSQGSDDGEFWFPNAVAVDDDGRIYVSDSNNGRVQVFDGSGTFLYSIGRGHARGDFSLPRGIAIDDDNHLFVVDTSRQAVQVYDISKSSDSEQAEFEPPEFLLSFGVEGTGESEFLFPNGLALDSNGTIYVTDRENNRVQVWRY